MLIALIILLFALSFLITWLVVKFSSRLRMINLPNERSLHSVPTPRGGGVAIVITWYIGITILYFNGFIEKNLFFSLLSGIVLAVIGLLDDIIEIKPSIRLVVQFITAILAFYFLGALRPLIIPTIEINYPLFIYPFAIVGVVWFINLFNFMDGVDGFASIEAIMISGVLFVFSGDILLLVLTAAISGFLYWNLPRAKIFMGDVGSTQLGFILVILGIYYHNCMDFSILNWIMLSSVFWFDATITIFRRIKNRERISTAHKKHAYQRLIQSGITHLKLDVYLIIINVVIIILIFLYRECAKEFRIPIYLISLIMLYTAIKIIDKRMPFNKN